jgi:hypothetical protein
MGAGCALAAHRWRWGVFAAIALGLIQDPLRKMIPGVPGYLTLTSLPVWLTAIGVGVVSGEISVRSFFASFPKLAKWIVVFGAYLIIPAVLSVSYSRNSWAIALLGGVTYATAFLVLIAGWRFPQSGASTSRLLFFYSVCTAAALIGGPLDYVGFGENLLMVGSAAMGHEWVTYRTGEAVHMLAGFFRSPDIMGWHAAMLTMVSSFMALRTRGWVRFFWLMLSVWGILNVWICGRRKMVSMLPLFWGFLLLLIHQIRQAKKLIPAAGIVLVISGLGWYGVASTYHTTAVDRFYLTTVDEWDAKLWQHGVQSVGITVTQTGFFGYGLGMSQQGLHHIAADKPRIWQESGPSKLIVELGVPGSVLLVVVGAVFLLTAYQVLRMRSSQNSFYLFSGLFALFLANLSSSMISAQIFGDPFVLVLLAFLMGLLLSGARQYPSVSHEESLR